MRDEVSRLEVPGELRLEVPELVPQAVPFPEDGSPRLLDRPQELGHPPVQVVRRGALVDERKEQERALVDGDLAPVHGHALQVPRTARSSEGIADEPRDQREHPGGGELVLHGPYLTARPRNEPPIPVDQVEVRRPERFRPQPPDEKPRDRYG